VPDTFHTIQGFEGRPILDAVVDPCICLVATPSPPTPKPPPTYRPSTYRPESYRRSPARLLCCVPNSCRLPSPCSLIMTA
jgi:hypothetical protein